MTILIPTIATSAGRDGSTVAAARAGARAMAPWLVGVVPFGVVVGATVAEGRVAAGPGLATGVTIYSGSAQLSALELLGAGAAPAVAVASVLAINARLVLYSGAMALHWRGTSRRFRLLASYLLVDPSYAVGADAHGDPTQVHPHAHYLGAGVTLWLSWQAAIVGGFLAGSSIPPGLGLRFAVPLYLVAEVVHKARTPPALAAAGTGAVVAVAGAAVPWQGGPLLGILAGVAVAATVPGRAS